MSTHSSRTNAADQIRAVLNFLADRNLLDERAAATAAANAELQRAFADEFLVVRNMAGIPLLPFDQVAETDIIVVYADTETTGKTARDEIIELGLIEVAIDSQSGQIRGLIDSFNGRREPAVPITPESQAIHNISIDDVRGLSFSAEDIQRIRQIVADAYVIVAHNAEFDRPFCERLDTCFTTASWACSFKEVDWRSAGFGSAKLEFLAMCQGIRYDAHSAFDDCTALAHVLSGRLPTGETGIGAILGTLATPSARESHRVWATHAPYEAREVLKSAGYVWSPGDAPGTEKAWRKEVSQESLENELSWLRANVYKSPSFSVILDDVTSHTRYSDRRINTRRITYSPKAPPPRPA